MLGFLTQAIRKVELTLVEKKTAGVPGLGVKIRSSDTLSLRCPLNIQVATVKHYLCYPGQETNMPSTVERDIISSLTGCLTSKQPMKR